MIARPLPGGQICGAGDIDNNNSAGYLKGAAAAPYNLTRFAFYVQYNKSLTNPQGGVEIDVDALQGEAAQEPPLAASSEETSESTSE